MKLPDVTTIDFETEAIESRPRYPPRPVGISIKERGQKPRYWAFGHTTENNCTETDARRALTTVYKSGVPLLTQNGKFDHDVAEAHWGLKLPSWERTHDTLYLLFFRNPHARSLSLKPSAETYLGMKPEERNKVNEWLKEHGFIRSVDQKDAGKYICKAPGKLVADYANGDTVRTEKLFDHLLPWAIENGLTEAYERERRVMPILLRNEREGMRVDMRRLGRDVKLYELAMVKADAWLRKQLKASNLNVGSNDELADALEAAGVVTEFAVTEKGNRSVAKDTLTVDRFHDKRVYAVLGYRNRLETCLSVFMRPWLTQALATGGRIHTIWNQVRQSHGDESKGGTRTGRLSSSPNFQNIPKDWYDKDDGYTRETMKAVVKLLKVPELPMMRVYILPDEGGVFRHRDFSQQELRLLAHFEDDKMCAAYNENPRLDIHTWVQELIHSVTGVHFERRPIKIINFMKIYGGGVAKMAKKIGCDLATAKTLKKAMSDALPGVRNLEIGIKMRAAEGKPIRTWGGRPYWCEPPAMIKGRRWTFEYKLLNYLIQGSAADMAKETLIRYDSVRKDGRLLVSVHDENNISATKGADKEEDQRLKEVMESLECDVPMLTDGKYGPNWFELKKLKEGE